MAWEQGQDDHLSEVCLIVALKKTVRHYLIYPLDRLVSDAVDEECEAEALLICGEIPFGGLYSYVAVALNPNRDVGEDVLCLDHELALVSLSQSNSCSSIYIGTTTPGTAGPGLKAIRQEGQLG